MADEKSIIDRQARAVYPLAYAGAKPSPRITESGERGDRGPFAGPERPASPALPIPSRTTRKRKRSTGRSGGR